MQINTILNSLQLFVLQDYNQFYEAVENDEIYDFLKLREKETQL